MIEEKPFLSEVFAALSLDTRTQSCIVLVNVDKVATNAPYSFLNVIAGINDTILILVGR